MQIDTERRNANLRTIARDVGALQAVLSAGMLAAMAVSLFFGELYSALALLASAAVSAAGGASLYRAGRNAPEPQRRDAMVIAGAGWFAAAVFGALPFLFAAYWTPDSAAQAFVPAGQGYASSLAYFRSPLHAFFESMSAYTTTGLTMAVHEPSLGYGLLFYRSLAQWIGGAGVVVLSLAIIPRSPLVGQLELYQSETSGAKLRPSILGTARAIWKVYGALTGGVVLYLFAATIVILPGYGLGPALFDAVNHAMTGLATGGFSVLDDSIAGYRSAAMEFVHLLPMVLGMISIPLYYSFARERRLGVFWRDPQFRAMSVVFGALIPLLILLLGASQAVVSPLREGLFQAVSGISGTGWQTSPVGDWNDSALLLLAWGGMVVSGAAGSTVGGVKLIRAYLIARAVGWRIQKVFLPAEAVAAHRVGDRTLSSEALVRDVHDAAVFCLLYLVVLTVSTVIVAHQTDPAFSLANVIFECVSAQSTVGLSTGITNPGMPVSVELVLIFQMWIGRLEIFPVIILLRTLVLWTLRR